MFPSFAEIQELYSNPPHLTEHINILAPSTYAVVDSFPTQMLISLAKSSLVRAQLYMPRERVSWHALPPSPRFVARFVN